MNVLFRHVLHAGVAISVAMLATLPARGAARIADGIPNGTIELHPSIRIAAGAEIRLADVARLDGAADVHAGLVIGRADAGAFELRPDLIRQKLVAAGVPATTVRIVGERTIVRPIAAMGPGRPDAAAAAAVPPARVGSVPPSERRARAARLESTRLVEPTEDLTGALALVADLLRNAFADDAAALRLEMPEAQIEAIPRAAGLRHEVVAKNALRSDRVEFEVLAYEGPRIVSRSRLLVEPKLARDAVVATSDLRRGATLDAGGTSVETRLVAPSLAARLAPADATRGRTLARPVVAGASIETSDLVAVLAVRRNEKVVVRREVGLVAIELEAVALEDGTVGDVVALRTTPRIRNREARPIQAEVVGPGRAVVRE